MAAVLKTAMARKRHRGFESHALRSSSGRPRARTAPEGPSGNHRAAAWVLVDAGAVTLMGAAALLDLVGRDAELQSIDTAVAALAGGRGGAVAQVGPGGVGKSRLAREAMTRAGAQGITALTGRAVATGGSTPYRPLIEALAPWARTRQPSDVDLGAHNRAYAVLV